MKKIVYLCVGFIALGLGGLGAFLPILPTVPFLLVSAYCFGKSSQKVDMWFKQTKLYKNNLESYVSGRGMSTKTKAKILSLVSCLMLIGFIMMHAVVIGRMCLIVVWIGHVWYFIYKVPTSVED